MLDSYDLEGCMLGRAAYENPWIFSDVDRRIFNKPNQNISRKEILYKFSEYVDKTFTEKDNPSVFIKPLINLFNGERKSADFRKMLSSFKDKEMSLGDHIKFCIEEYEKLNKKAVNKIPDDK